MQYTIELDIRFKMGILNIRSMSLSVSQLHPSQRLIVKIEGFVLSVNQTRLFPFIFFINQSFISSWLTCYTGFEANI